MEAAEGLMSLINRCNEKVQINMKGKAAAGMLSKVGKKG